MSASRATPNKAHTEPERVHNKLRRLLRDQYPAGRGRGGERNRMSVSAGSSVQELERMLAVKRRQEAKRVVSAQQRASVAVRARAIRAARSERLAWE